MQQKTSFKQIIQLVFVFFSLYLLGDAFYRWDGFRYYSTFSEFLPGAALAFILWTAIAVMVSALLWLIIKFISIICVKTGLKINQESIFIFICWTVAVGAVLLFGKRSFIQEGLSVQIIFGAVVLLFIIALILTKVSKGKLDFVLERLTPLLWLFMAVTAFSAAVVVYSISGNDTAALNTAVNTQGVNESRPNIVLVTFDAMATKDMSLHGYDRDTTPFIRQWAKTAYVFTNLKAEDGFTTPTVTSLMTGKRLWTHQTYHQRSEIPGGNFENIARSLRENGYYTVAYTENSNASPVSLNIYKSFDFYKSFISEEKDPLSRFHMLLYRVFFGKIKLYDWILLDDFAPTKILKTKLYYPIYYPIYKKKLWEKKRASTLTSVTVLEKFTSDLHKKNFSEPFFAWIHLMPPHEPYLPPEPFMGSFDLSQDLRTFDEQFIYRRLVKERFEKSEQLTERELDLLNTYRARYDENILFCDKKFEKFMDQLNKMNKLDNTVIILSSDHGESFEDKMVGHGAVLYEQVMNVPLVIKYPSRNSGMFINDLIEQIDIPATILDIANIPPPPWMEGRSLTPLMNNQKIPPMPAFSMHLELNRGYGHKIEKGIFAVWEGDYKLIHYLEQGRSLLFNLKKDPEEEDNLINKEPQTGKYLVSLIQDNLKNANEIILKGR